MLQNGSFEVEVLVNGVPVKEYEHKGSVFVEGRKGSDFSIRIKNNSWSRILAVLTVDGKSVIDGKPGSLEKSGGYVLDSKEHVTVPGWRLNNSEVAKFVFADKAESYAAKIDDGATENVGIIGCAFFNEEVAYNPIFIKNPVWTSDNSSIPRWDGGAIPCSTTYDCASHDYSTTKGVRGSSTPVSNSIGTGFGSAEKHSVKTVDFRKLGSANTVITIFYDDRAGLEARGIDMAHKASVVPSAFPGSEIGCKPPEGWTRK